MLLDRERCVLCARCTRFSEQIAGDPFIALIERGALQQVGIYEKEPFESYFSGNTIQICPVGALTSRGVPLPLAARSTWSPRRRCASTARAGCALRTDHRRGKVMRRLAGDDPEVNEEWISDKDRFAFRYDRAGRPAHHARWSATRRPASSGRPRGPRRSPSPPAAWPRREPASVGVLTGGRLTGEDAYAYSKFARVALGTNDIDFRARPHSAEEADFLAAHVASAGPSSVTYADLEQRQRRAAGRLRARGRVADRLPAAAQGRP